MGKIIDRLWTRDFTMITLANLTFITSIYLLMPTLPKYAASMLGANEMMIGLAIGITSIVAVVARPFGGFFLDTRPRRKVFLLSLVGVILVMLSYNLAVSYLLLLAVRVGHGMFSGVASSSGQTIVGDIVPKKRRGEGVGYYGVAMSIAMAVGPYIGVLLTADNNYNRLFLTSTALAVITLLLILPLRIPKNEPVKRSLSLSTLIEVKVLPLSLLIGFVFFAFGGVISFVSIYSDEIGIKNGGGYFFLVFATAVALARPFSGRIFDRKGPGIVLISGFTSLLIGYLILSQWKSTTGFFIAAPLIGIGNGLCQPTLFAMIFNMVPGNRSGAATSTVYAAVDAGNAIGAIGLGVIASATSLSTVYLVSGLAMIIPLLYFIFHVNKHYRKTSTALEESIQLIN